MNLIPERISSFINAHHVFTLATNDDNKTWCCNCFYTYIDNEAALLFTSDNETKHITMGLKNPQISGSIVLETKIIGKIQGIQFTGELVQVDNSEHSKYRLKYLKKFPFAIIVNTQVWKINLDTIKMTDNRLGFGKKLIWTRNESTTI